MRTNPVERPNVHLLVLVLLRLRTQICVSLAAAFLAVYVFPRLASFLNQTPNSIGSFFTLAMLFLLVIMMMWTLRLYARIFIPSHLRMKYDAWL